MWSRTSPRSMTCWRASASDRHVRETRMKSLPYLVVACCCCALAASARAAPLSIKVVDEAGAPLADAAVAVFVDGAARRATNASAAEMAQRGRRFMPAVLVVQTGTPVHFPNFDTVRHHVYSFSPIKPFEIKLYAGTPAEPVVFDKPGTAVLGCNIHDTMSAYVHVVDTPHFALTDEQGRAQLDLPAGLHQVRLWHPRLGPSATPATQPLDGGARAVTLSLKAP